MTRLQRWILGVVAVLAVLAVFVVFLRNSYVPLNPQITPTPIVVSPTPSVSMTAVTPTPTLSSTASATPSATSATPTPSESVRPSSMPSATPSLPVPVICDVNTAEGVRNLASCKVTRGGKTYTAVQVLDICQAAANASMWQVSEGRFGVDLPVNTVEKYITICLNGAGLNDNNPAPSVLGYPVMDKKASNYGELRYIVLVGGYGDSEEYFLYDARTGKVKDDDALKSKVLAWNNGGGVG